MILLGGLLAALAVAAGAFGAHGLESRLDPNEAATPEEAQLRTRQLENFRTAAHYQLFAALGMVLCGLIGAPAKSKPAAAAANALFVGILFFSGGLYAWVLTEHKFFVKIVPIGGIAFIVGFALLGWAGWRMPRPALKSSA